MALSNLIITGGINHDFPDTALALKEQLEKAGIESTIFNDIDSGLQALGENNYDLLTMITLRWRMLDDDKYIPHREQWAYEISDADQRRIQTHISQGGGMLGLHTTCICFDTWKEWSSLLGAQWVWGETFHPPPAKFLVQDINQNHPSTDQLEEFEIVDEIYHNLRPEPDVELLFATRSAVDNSVQALSWAQQVGEGRVIYNALGHDRASVETPGHSQFLQQSALWCCGNAS